MSQAVNSTGPATETVFHVHGLTKVYHMGEVEVHALCGVDLDLYAGELMVLRGKGGNCDVSEVA